jgi:hypothetical protein
VHGVKSGVRCVVCGVWCGVHGLWRVVCWVWCRVCRVVVCGVSGVEWCEGCAGFQIYVLVLRMVRVLQMRISVTFSVGKWVNVSTAARLRPFRSFTPHSALNCIRLLIQLYVRIIRQTLQIPYVL